jgi:hypothetical protein
MIRAVSPQLVTFAGALGGQADLLDVHEVALHHFHIFGVGGEQDVLHAEEHHGLENEL